MTEPTPDQLAEWRRLAEAATEGPWEAYSLPEVPPGQWQMVGVGQVGNELGHRIEAMFDDDAAFIAASRTAVPVLLEEVRRLRGQVDLMEQRTREEIAYADEAQGERDAWEESCQAAEAERDRLREGVRALHADAVRWRDDLRSRAKAGGPQATLDGREASAWDVAAERLALLEDR